MNFSLLLDFLTFALPSGFLSGVATWLVSQRKRNNDQLAHMQQSIDLLCEKYNAVLQENVTLRQEKAGWQVLHEELLLKIDRLTREVATLRKNINRNTKAYESIQSDRALRGAPADSADNGRLRRHETECGKLGSTTKRTAANARKEAGGLADIESGEPAATVRLLDLHTDHLAGDDPGRAGAAHDSDPRDGAAPSGSDLPQP